MTIRLLKPEERPDAERLHAESEPCGVLHENCSLVGAFTDEGELVAALGVESLVFLGPLVVKREWRGKLIPSQLVDYVEERIPKGKRVGIYTSNGHVRKLAGAFGMQELEGTFHMKEVE